MLNKQAKTEELTQQENQTTLDQADLTEEQLEVIAGGTNRTGGIAGGGCTGGDIPGLPRVPDYPGFETI
jgi:hypothetical protein